ncbi:T-complex protein 11-like protein 1 [Bombyx mandarina]|uniref:T-complex protein 11-like protein 1 n=1 Tax=Bombyx mandarina TaxID=7092 RepID=A0A6J2KPS2_BOMMA|nr:T-complex protein 11-like protein 1 [Bombyx mandarina]XP_028042962.1 T-complex protein 11-like protein 1 [Bombyx mandarina]
MSERENPTSSGSKDQNEANRTSSQPVPMASSNSSYFSGEPIHFRVRGSTITGASPPQFVTLEDIMKAAHGMQNMALAHEIAVDNDFKLEPFDPPDNSYQKLVKETMHRAYFDILREQLNSNPPEYKQALILLEDVKQGLFSILLPRHTRIREMIEEVIDADFIKQQAETNSLDFKKYANFVVDLMAKLAAPARDEMIQNITTLTDTVEVFRAILEALEVLKLDLANTLITMIRPHVQKESVQYERAKFDEMLKVSEDGLQNTREWLKRHIDKTDLSIPVTDQNIIRNVTAQTLAKAYLELLEWDSSKGYPETVAIDAPRFSELGVQVYRMSCAAALLLASPACSSDADTAARHKEALKQKLFIIIDEASNDTELRSVLPSVAEEVVLATEQLLEKLNQPPLNSETKELIRTQIISLGDPEHRVREIVRQRVLEFLKVILVCGGGSRQIPVGLSVLSRELTDVSGTLLRYVMHNKAVFTQHYLDIVAEELSRN